MQSSKTLPLDQRFNRCPQCGSHVPVRETYCTACGYPIAAETPAKPKTGTLIRRPTTLPPDQEGNTVFEANAHVLLQFLPSGDCLALPLEYPTFLGRGDGPPDLEFLDLGDFNALKHGVSRLHCRLERRGSCLLIADMGSRNGTYVNNEPLQPHHEKVIASGDRLILGSLHIAVSFSSVR
ncbi:MAG TPA: FHA domain-containing protein [Aggregatilineaceae bacterium]|nr:FHA domain-containing protein [Aggregatilineaceae bacterium]